MKKEYQKPQIEVVKVNMSCQILAGSSNPQATSVDGNVFNSTISGGSGGGRSRGCDDWDEE